LKRVSIVVVGIQFVSSCNSLDVFVSGCEC
jgi:hypothetical protein